jgi:2-methylcitrate dehydratase PrpD
MLGLDGTQTAHALSLALMLSSGGIGQFRGDPSGRWFIFGMAVTQGIRAAISAREGLLGDLSLLDGTWFMQTHGIEAKTQPFQRIDLQRSVYSGLSIKPFCSSKQCMASVESLRQILDRGVSPDEITRVAVNVPTAYANMIRTKARPHARSSTLVSAAHQLALAAWKPEGLYDVDRAGSIDDPNIVSFAAKVEVVDDAQLMTRYPEFWPARLEVQAGGKVHHAEITSAKGDPANAFSSTRKAHRILDGKRGTAAVDRWLAASKHAASRATTVRSKLYAKSQVGALLCEHIDVVQRRQKAGH